jgi:hypothetical protein
MSILSLWCLGTKELFIFFLYLDIVGNVQVRVYDERFSILVQYLLKFPPS